MAILRRFGTNTVSVAAGTAVGNVTSDALLPILQDLINTTWAAHQSLPLTPEQAAAAVERGEMSYAEAEAESRLSGIRASRFRVLERLAGLAPSTDQLVSLRRRGLIDEARMRKGFVQGNVRSEWSDVLAGLAEQLLSTSELANMVVQNVMPESEATAAAEQVGIKPENFARLVRLSGNPIAPTEALTLWNRGEIEEADVDRALRQSRLKPEWIEQFKKLRKHWPSPSDAIRFAVKDVFSPDVRARFGLDDDFPDSFLKLAGQLGIDREQAEWYWAAHWRNVSPTQLYRMLHRGEITDADLDAGLKVADYSPFWRGKLKNIAYLVPGRIDLRRFYAEKIITEAEVFDGYKRLGYNDVDARRQADFAVKFAKGTAKEATATDYLTLYAGGHLSRGELQAALRELGYDDDDANRKADVLDARRAASAHSTAITGIHAAFKRHDATGNEVDAALTKLGVAEWARSAMIEAWTVERDLARPELTQAQIVGAYRRAVITREQALADLANLGFDPDDAGALLDTGAVVLTVKQIQDAVDAETISRDEGLRRLRAQGYSAADAEILLPV